MEIKVIICENFENPNSLRTGVIVKPLNKDGYIQVRFSTGEKELMHEAYVFPIKYEEELKTILTERKRLQDALNSSMKLVYQLRNKIKRDLK